MNFLTSTAKHLQEPLLKGRCADDSVCTTACYQGTGHASEKVKRMVVLSADSKRQKGQEILKDSYLTHQAMSFADRQAEQRLQEAQRVRCCLLLQSLTVLLPVLQFSHWQLLDSWHRSCSHEKSGHIARPQGLQSTGPT